MTISSTTRIAGPFIGNGTASAFPFTFKVFAATDLDVIKLTISTGTESTLVLTTDYTVSLNGDQNSNPGGTVTLTAGALASGFTLTITSDIANLQPTDLTNQGGFYPEVITDSLDRATIQIQQIADIGDRTLKIPISDGTLNMELPTKTERANTFLSFDANGLPSVVTAGSSGAPATITRQVFSGTGSQTVFTLASDPGALGNSAQVYIGGVYQQRSTYTIAGTTLTFSAAPVAGTNNIEFVNFLTSNLGAISADLVTYTPSGVGAIARSAASKFGETVSVKDFGAVGDGVANDAPAVQAALAALFASNGNTLEFPNGTYYLASPVTITFPNTLYNRSIRIVGTSTAGFVSGQPGGTKITGASGLSALFVITQSNVAIAGGYAFECSNIDFDGNSLGIGSAILNLMGGAPARPFTVRCCNFRRFQKAISSDISATGLTTGLCQVNIESCNFQANQYALHGKGQSAIMDLRFVGNVCEQNSLGGIYTESVANGSLGGTFEIADNLLEGQPNAIDISVGLSAGTIARNYFESNTGYLVRVASANSATRMYLGPNFITSCSGCKVVLSNVSYKLWDNYALVGVLFDPGFCNPESNAPITGIVTPEQWSRVYSFSTTGYQIPNSVAPAVLDSGSYSSFSLGYESTPLGFVGYGDGSLPLLVTSASLNADDALVAICLARHVSGTPSVAGYLYDNASNYLSNTSSQQFLATTVQSGEWFMLVCCIRTPSSSSGVARFRWLVSGGTMHFTKTYTYRVPNPTNASTAMYLHLPYFSPLYGTSTYDPPSLNDGDGATTTITVTGAALGDMVDGLSFSNDLQGITLTGYVSAANTVSVRFQNESGSVIDLASGTLGAIVRKL